MWNRKGTSGFKYMPRLEIYRDGKNNEFDPKTFSARSYRHWLYVMKLKNGKVVFNDYRYSVSTSGHQSSMRSLLFNELKVNKSDVIFVSQVESLDKGIVLDNIYKQMYLAEIRSKRKGMRAQFLANQADIIKSCKDKIKFLRKYGAKNILGLDLIKCQVTDREASRLERQREESRKQRELLKTIVKENINEINNMGVVSC